MINKKTVGYQLSNDGPKADFNDSSPQDLLEDWLSHRQSGFYVSVGGKEEQGPGEIQFSGHTQAESIAAGSTQFFSTGSVKPNPEVHIAHRKPRSAQESVISEQEARRKADYFATLLTEWSVADSYEELADDPVLAEFDVTADRVEKDLERLSESLRRGDIPEDVLDTITEKVVAEQLNFIREVTGDETTGDQEGAKEVLKQILQSEN